MSSPITQAGGLTSQSEFAPLHTNRFMTGLWTNRNQLRDAATTFLYEKFYSATRFDSLIGGSNGELTPKMTMKRRPGHSVYNSQNFPAINRFYPFKAFSTSTETIRVMADTAASVYDATGPNRKLNIWNKSFGAGDTTFMSVGNNLFFGNGVDQKKWVQEEPQWSAGAIFNAGKYIVDSNNNLQVAEGGIVVGVVSVAVAGNVLTLTLDPNDVNLPSNLMALVGLPLNLSGFISAGFLNGQTITIASVPQGSPAYSSNVLTAALVHADYGPVGDNGAANSGSGITGVAQPAWSTVIGAYTSDGGQQWICKGPSVQNWGIAAPTAAPSVVQSALPTIFPAWSANTYFSTCFLIVDAAGFIQMVTTFGTTGSIIPVFNDVLGGLTGDGTVMWTCQGSGTYVSNTAVALGAYVIQTDALGKQYFYKALTAGITAIAPPIFTAPLNSQVIDNTVTWENVGVVQAWGNITSSTMNGNFGFIPLQGGGSICLGVGQAAANGTIIALPTGFNLANSLSWSTAGPGFNSGIQISGVFQSTSAGGVLNSNFQNRSNGIAFAATSNWAIAAWTAGAAVTVSAVGGFQFAQFTTALGDVLCFCSGTAGGGAVPVPAGFLATQFVNIAGLAGTNPTGNGMNAVIACQLDFALNLTVTYDDDNGHTWGGQANIFGLFYQATGGVIAYGGAGSTAITIPTAGPHVLAVIQAQVNNGASMPLPPGFASYALAATAAIRSSPLSGSNVSHGWPICGMTGLVFNGQIADGGGVYSVAVGNVFAVAAILVTTPISPAQKVVDSNSNLQTIAISGLSGAIAPAWQTRQGAGTIDNAATWTNTGITTAARTQPSQWAFAFKSAATNHTSTASKLSGTIFLDANNFAFMQGSGSPDEQADIIVIYRIPQGGSTLLFLDEIPAPPAGQMWQYKDLLPDSFLNQLLPAAIAHSNDPPPVGFKPLEYHLSRVFGAVGNVLSWSNGTQQTGDPNQSFLPDNRFTYPARVVRAWACTLGLIVFTVSDVFIVLGSGTDADPLFTKKYIPGLGLLSYDAFTLNKTTPYLMNSTKNVMALDPSAGLIEPGFPIADQFDSLYDPSTAQLTWHEGSHGDTALYVGDDEDSWFRMAALSAPEQGLVWSPMGTIASGYKAMSSVEVTKGQKLLLLGPAANGPILYRDPTVNTDVGTTFPWYPILGSIVLAQPGQVAELDFFTLESVKIGTQATVSVMLGEIDGPLHPDLFELLYPTRQDPPLLPKAKTLYNDRFAMMQNQQTTYCRHLQIRFDWPAEDAPNELLTYTIFGALHNETESK
jgi:hypothetical protein